MSKKKKTKHEIFLDTAFTIALSSENDRYHKRALDLAEQLERSATLW